MKYRVSSIKTVTKKSSPQRLRARRNGSTALRVFAPLPEKIPSSEYIDFGTLFETGALPQAKRPPRRAKIGRALKRAWVSVKVFFACLGLRIGKLFGRLRHKKHQKNRRLAFFSGALCAAVCVMIFSAVTVIAGLFAGYLAPYDELVIPNLVGDSLANAALQDGESYRLLVSYENSEDISAGIIIAQTPSSGVVRKIYKNGDLPTVTLTVSMGRHYYEIGDFVGTDERLALLELHNTGVPVEVIYEHSSTVSSGVVISTSPKSGERLYDDDILTLKVSLGKQIKSVTVPDLYGLSEAQAQSILSSRGLALGKTVYKVSQSSVGKIIGQSVSPYSRIAEGSEVDITVSLGNTASQKLVPDLYGLDTSGAEKRLAEVGLVIGSIYHVSSGAPVGTVVAQTPIAGTPITSVVTSVDIYVSS